MFSTAQIKSYENMVYITASMTLEEVVRAIAKCKANFTVNPDLIICAGAKSDVVRHIPADFNSAAIRRGVGREQLEALPAHLRVLEVMFGVEPDIMEFIPASIKILSLTGVTENFMRAIPVRFNILQINKEISALVMKCTPPHVHTVFIKEGITADALKATPDTVKLVYFKYEAIPQWDGESGYISEYESDSEYSYHEFLSNLKNYLASIPQGVTSVGLCIKTPGYFVAALPPQVDTLIVDTRALETGVLSQATRSIRTIDFAVDVSDAVLNEIPLHVVTLNAKSTLSEEMQNKIQVRQNELNAARRMIRKRPAVEEISLEDAPAIKAPRHY